MTHFLYPLQKKYHQGFVAALLSQLWLNFNLPRTDDDLTPWVLKRRKVEIWTVVSVWPPHNTKNKQEPNPLLISLEAWITQNEEYVLSYSENSDFSSHSEVLDQDHISDVSPISPWLVTSCSAGGPWSLKGQ